MGEVNRTQFLNEFAYQKHTHTHTHIKDEKGTSWGPPQQEATYHHCSPHLSDAPHFSGTLGSEPAPRETAGSELKDSEARRAAGHSGGAEHGSERRLLGPRRCAQLRTRGRANSAQRG